MANQSLALRLTAFLAVGELALCCRGGEADVAATQKSDTTVAKRADAAGLASQWPVLRGPNYDAHAADTGLIDAFPPTGPPVLWTRGLGAGYSGFVGAAGRVYTQYQTLGGQYLVCLDATSGETLWQHRYEAPYDSAGMYPGPRATPSLSEGRVFFSSPRGLVGCLDANSGRSVWSINLFDQLAVEPVEFGYSCSPTPLADKLLLPVGRPQASMVALETQTGRVVWQSGNDPISHVPALPIELAGQQLILGYLRNALVAFELETGRIAWRKELSQGYDEHAAWPIYREPYLWIAGPFQAGSELFELTAEPPGIRSVWKSKLLSNDVCSSVLVDGCLYGFDIRDAQTKSHRPSRGQFRAIDFLTGEQRWANGPAPGSPRVAAEGADPSVGSAIGQATVLYADGKLILFNDLGELILARASPQRYEELGRSQVLGGELCWTPPTLLDGRLYVRNHSRAACLVLRAGASNGAAASAKLTVTDIPQSAYRDWAAMLLAAEPEYSMDLPSRRQLTLWFVACLGILLAAALLAGLGGAAAAYWRSWFDPGPSENLPAGSRAPDTFSAAPTRCVADRCFGPAWLAGSFVLGAMGTTLLSGFSGQFVFTWPVCVFVAFQQTVDAAGKRANQSAAGRWSARLRLAAFLAVCAGYYLICRRLSLATEWVFLTGFLPAVPVLVWTRRQSPGTWLRSRQLMLSLLAFGAYYWCSLAVLAWRYR